MTAITNIPFPCLCNLTLLGIFIFVVLIIGWIIAITSILTNIIYGGKDFNETLRLSSPIKETIYAIVICIALILTYNIWGSNFIFKSIQFEDLENVELIEEIYPDSMKVNTNEFVIVYNKESFEYEIPYNKESVGVKTVTDDILYIEHYKGEYSVFPMTSTFEYFILHIPKGGINR